MQAKCKAACDSWGEKKKSALRAFPKDPETSGKESEKGKRKEGEEDGIQTNPHKAGWSVLVNLY